MRASVGVLVRHKLIVWPIYLGLIAGTVWIANAVPRGFIPTLDQGYAIVVIQLPDGSSLSRTDAVVQRASQIMRETPGVQDAVAFAGFSGATFTNAPNAAAIFARFRPFDERLPTSNRRAPSSGSSSVALQAIEEAFIIAIPPPPVRGLGNSGGFRIQLQERTGDDLDRVLAATYELMGRARQNPNLAGVFTTFSANSPQIYLEIDRVKARILNVPIPNIFETLQVNLGTAYVNDFNFLGRIWQVRAQADQRFRVDQTRHQPSARPLVDRRPGADGHIGGNAGCDGSRSRPALQHVHVRALAGKRRAGRVVGHRARHHGKSRARRPPAGHELRVDRARLSGARRPATPRL